MTTENNQNKVLFIYSNYKETADELPKKYQGEFWRLVINYTFDGEESIKDDLEETNKYVKIAFFSIKNLLKLNKKSGSQNGKSNNPSGLVKGDEPKLAPNLAPNLTPNPYIKEKNINKNKKENIKEKKFYVEAGKFYIDDDEKYCEGYTDLVKQLPQEKRDSLCEWFFKNFEYKEIDLSFIRRVLQKAIEGGENAD